VGTLLVDKDRRLLVTTGPAPADKAKLGRNVETREWSLYDLETPARMTKVAEGKGQLVPIPNSPYLISTSESFLDGPPEFDELLTFKGSREVVSVHSARTGAIVHEHRAAAPLMFEINPLPAFDATGERMVLISGTTIAGARFIHPVEVKVVETRTGKPLWNVELGESRHVAAAFSPNGRHLVVLDSPSNSGNTRMRVYTTADGGLFWTNNTPTPGAFPLDRHSRLIVFSADARLVATAMNDAVDVWNLETGERAHHFTGHAYTPREVLFTPDGARLFVAVTAQFAQKSPARLHVWDLTTGRELLALPTIVARLSRFDAGKLYIGNDTFLDGTPVKP
jgi:WD40 repeat protein